MCPKGHNQECCWYGHIRHHSIPNLPFILFQPMRDLLMMIGVVVVFIGSIGLIILSNPFDIIEHYATRIGRFFARLFKRADLKPPSEPR